MKIPKDNVSAFSVYSEKFKQKKKSKLASNGVNKVKKKTTKNQDLETLQANEVSNIMQFLASKSKKLNDKKIKNEGFFVQPDGINKIKNLTAKKKSKSNAPKAKLKTTNMFQCEAQEDFKDLQRVNCEAEVYKSLKTATKETSKPNSELKIKRNLACKNKTLLKHKKKQTNNKLRDETRFSSHDKDASQNSKGGNFDGENNIQHEPNKTEYKFIKQKSSVEDSLLEAKELFESLIVPVSENEFMSKYWEKEPFLIQRENHRDLYSSLISTPEIDGLLKKNNVQFTKHLDVTSYTDKGRETHNPLGRAHSNLVWDYYSNGCSIRLLNPQAFLPKIHDLNATLQGYFGCFVGANVYLTPPNSQGFAPHFDDIEAFVFQIEGKKHWKVYNPRSEKEMLPRYSSRNFKQDEIGEPILDIVLEPGDLLYFPRGYIHQASTVEGVHSLHITLSTYQKTAWIDLLEKTLPIALAKAAAENVELRRGLPRDYLNVQFQNNDKLKKSFVSNAQQLMTKVLSYFTLALGAGVDLMGAQFMHDCLPPLLSSYEKQNSAFGSGFQMKENGELMCKVELDLDSEIKLIRPHVCSLSEEDGELRLYHCLDNPLEYHAQDPQFLVLPACGGPIMNILYTRYPDYTSIRTFTSIEKEEPLMALISDLWDVGILLVKTKQ